MMVVEIGVRLVVATLGFKNIRFMDGKDQRLRLKGVELRDHK